MRNIIKAQMDFSKRFREKATITDIIFLSYCMIYPYFLPKPIYFVILFSSLEIAYMNEVIKKPSLDIFKTPLASK